jgi:predicted Zn-dependent peptidase
MPNKPETYSWPNGFRVIYEKSHVSVNDTHIQVFCDVGSAYETDNLRGASHFIEHMCFKGTHKVPTTKELMVNYDRIGAYFNAYTEKRYTCYVLRCDDEYIENSLVIMSEMILNSRFDKKEFVKEQRVVVEENIRDSDDPVSTIGEITTMFL